MDAYKDNAADERHNRRTYASSHSRPVCDHLDLGEVPNVIPECSELEKVIEVMGRLCYRSWAPGDEWGP